SITGSRPKRAPASASSATRCSRRASPRPELPSHPPDPRTSALLRTRSSARGGRQMPVVFDAGGLRGGGGRGGGDGAVDLLLLATTPCCLAGTGDAMQILAREPAHLLPDGLRRRSRSRSSAGSPAWPRVRAQRVEQHPRERWAPDRERGKAWR